jgi:hypothetical protein
MYRLNGGEWTRAVGDALVSDEGVHRVEYYSADAAGNVEEAGMLTISIDLSGPRIIILSPENGASTNESGVEVRWDCEDDDSGIVNCEVMVDDGEWEDLGNDTSSVTLDLEDGEHEITLRLTDGAGNVVEETVTVTVDTVPPADDEPQEPVVAPPVEQGGSGGSQEASTVGGQTLLLALIAIVLAATALLLVAMRRKRRAGETDPDMVPEDATPAPAPGHPVPSTPGPGAIPAIIATEPGVPAPVEPMVSPRAEPVVGIPAAQSATSLAIPSGTPTPIEALPAAPLAVPAPAQSIAAPVAISLEGSTTPAIPAMSPASPAPLAGTDAVVSVPLAAVPMATMPPPG